MVSSGALFRNVLVIIGFSWSIACRSSIPAGAHVTRVAFKDVRVQWDGHGADWEPDLQVRTKALDANQVEITEGISHTISTRNSPVAFHGYEVGVNAIVHYFRVEFVDVELVGRTIRWSHLIAVQGQNHVDCTLEVRNRYGKNDRMTYNILISWTTQSPTTSRPTTLRPTEPPTFRPTRAPTVFGSPACSDKTNGVPFTPGLVHGCSGVFSGGVSSASAQAICGFGWRVCGYNTLSTQYLRKETCEKPSSNKFFASKYTSNDNFNCRDRGETNGVFGCGAKLDFVQRLNPVSENCGSFTLKVSHPFQTSTGWQCPGCTTTNELTHIANTNPNHGGVLCCVEPCTEDIAPQFFVHGTVYGCAAQWRTNGMLSQGVTDACAPRWHVCRNRHELETLNLTASSCISTVARTFFATRERARLDAGCDSFQDGSDDVYGCGNPNLDFTRPSNGVCGVLSVRTKNRHIFQVSKEYEPLQTWICTDCEFYSEFLKIQKYNLAGGGVLCCVDEQTDPPTFAPTQIPTSPPSTSPTGGPSQPPSAIPSQSPTRAPSSMPSNPPTSTPTIVPTAAPSQSPTSAPSQSPSSYPTHQPQNAPTHAPTQFPSNAPSSPPTKTPSSIPSNVPSTTPSSFPTKSPSFAPSNIPSTAPSIEPTRSPTGVPTSHPSKSPSAQPSTAPSQLPTNAPTWIPSGNPTISPSAVPTAAPTLTPGTVRLIGGTGPVQQLVGFVEISVAGEWGTICSDGWTKQNCDVVCKQLGYPGTKQIYLVSANFNSRRDASVPQHLNNVNCTGNEGNLLTCKHDGIKNIPSTCSHSKDAGCECCVESQTCGGTTKPQIIRQSSSTTIHVFDRSPVGLLLGIIIILLSCILCVCLMLLSYRCWCNEREVAPYSPDMEMDRIQRELVSDESILSVMPYTPETSRASVLSDEGQVAGTMSGRMSGTLTPTTQEHGVRVITVGGPRLTETTMDEIPEDYDDIRESELDEELEIECSEELYEDGEGEEGANENRHTITGSPPQDVRENLPTLPPESIPTATDKSTVGADGNKEWEF